MWARVKSEVSGQGLDDAMGTRWKLTEGIESLSGVRRELIEGIRGLSRVRWKFVEGIRSLLRVRLELVEARIRKVEGTTFAKNLTGKPRVSGGCTAIAQAFEQLMATEPPVPRNLGTSMIDPPRTGG
ncbi:hypothetical protein B296_00007051 [Ensete ventricosum]|uniref:Uncharacterized protein n=1 Tax=Ensete ventricosum TaxID=4639 RepID=A0A426ZVX2_ENSVE|nr:hypothetical protein B296_00007051 [Ensete ventricosum]